MKRLLFLLSLMTTAYASPNWVMVKYSTPLAYEVNFDCLEEDVLISKVVRKGLFTPRYYYDLYSREGAFVARAINRVLSLGMFFPSQMEFDLYDDREAYIGSIIGKLWTSGEAKFVFAKAEGEEKGFALLSSDSDQAVFSLLSPKSPNTATLTGALSGDLSRWQLEMKNPVDIDGRALKIFAAFISDFHASFIRKPETHHHYHDSSQGNRMKIFLYSCHCIQQLKPILGIHCRQGSLLIAA